MQGWQGGSSGGVDGTIFWNGGSGDNILGRGSSSNGNGWSRAGNGGDSYRSFNIARIHSIEHGLTAGATIEIGLMIGAWNTTGATINYSYSYRSRRRLEPYRPSPDRWIQRPALFLERDAEFKVMPCNL